METVGQYITHVSSQLNDQQFGRAFTRWGRALLLQYLNIGLSEIGTYRPEAFSVPTILTLKPGTEQFSGNETGVIAIYSNVNGPIVRAADGQISNSFAVYDICPPDVRFVNGQPVFWIKSYSIDPTNTGTFYVEPPVPNGMAPQVNALIPGDTPQYALADWNTDVAMPHKFDKNLVDAMLAQAYSLDMESPESRNNSEMYTKRFYTSMGVKYTQESKFRSGYYLGELGTGNPRP